MALNSVFSLHKAVRRIVTLTGFVKIDSIYTTGLVESDTFVVVSCTKPYSVVTATV